MRSPSGWRAGAATLFLLVASPAAAEPATTILANGDPANRLDIAILGDGYTADELDDFAQDALGLAVELLSEAPFDAYAPYVNVHRVDLESAESGADHPERVPAVSVDTALGATYDCAGIQRLICVNVVAVYDALFRSLVPEQYDVVVVLVNDPEYGGSGGLIAVGSTHPTSSEIVEHELGHSFGRLADEYAGGGPSCNLQVHAEPNVSPLVERDAIEWSRWIDPLTEIPTTTALDGIPGLYEGARYCDTGLYRPTWNSKMRSLGRPWEPVNTEQLVRRIYNWVAPIDAWSPAQTLVDLGATGGRTFEVELLAPTSHALDTTWFVDGSPVAVGPELVLDATDLDAGAHEVRAEVADPTSFVRNDPFSLLRDEHVWSVLVAADTDGDGVPDDSDDCIEVADPAQGDVDDDGFGDACDCDFQGDGFCNVDDFGVLLVDLIVGSDSGTGTDMTGDGSVNVDDFGRFLAGFLAGTPGPSALAP